MQPHGALLAVRAESLLTEICQRKHRDPFLDRPATDCIGRPLAELIGADNVEALSRSRAGTDPAGYPETLVPGRRGQGEYKAAGVFSPPAAMT